MGLISRQYGQKLALLAGASEQLCRVLPSSPPDQYTGAQQTAAVRAALQNALDSGYVPKNEHLPLNVGQSVAGETRSFGETHASELNSIATVTDNGHDAHDASAPINPAALNNNPAPIPSTTHYTAPSTGPPATVHHYAAPSVAPPSSYAPPAAHSASPYSPPAVAPSPVSTGSVPHAPTVAETGVPVSAGTEGPGPATGSLGTVSEEVRDRPTVGYGVGSNEQAPAYGGAAPLSVAPHESATDEKRRLASAQQTETTAPAPYAPLGLPHDGHQGGLAASTSTRRPATHESAEDEKKRLEREEREALLRGNNTRENTLDDGTGGAAAPPAYHD